MRPVPRTTPLLSWQRRSAKAHVFRQTVLPSRRTAALSPAQRPLPVTGNREEDPAMMSKTTVAWPTFIQLLQAYANEHGHTRVPQKETVLLDGQEVALGRRVNQVRTRKRAGKLTPAQVAQLEQLPGWTWDALEPAADRAARWDATFSEVEQHQAQHGDLTKLPQRLRQWLLRQRRAAQAGQLDQHRVQVLLQLPGGIQTPGRSRVEHFAGAAHTWLQANPGSTMADLPRDGAVVHYQGQDVDLYRRALYYRRRRAGLEGSRPLPDSEAQVLEKLPGWNWNIQGVSTS